MTQELFVRAEEVASELGISKPYVFFCAVFNLRNLLYIISSGVRFFLAICNTSDVVLLFYTTSEVYTKFGMVSKDLLAVVIGFEPPSENG